VRATRGDCARAIALGHRSRVLPASTTLDCSTASCAIPTSYCQRPSVRFCDTTTNIGTVLHHVAWHRATATLNCYCTTTSVQLTAMLYSRLTLSKTSEDCTLLLLGLNASAHWKGTLISCSEIGNSPASLDTWA
jgi:hypothetical protein